MTFIDDLDFGKIFEKKCLDTINSNKAFKVIKENDNEDYDLAFINRITGKVYLLECKSDRKSQYTGNIFLETSYGKSKSINKSLANYYAFDFKVDNFNHEIIISKEKLLKINGEKTKGGDFNISTGLLIPVFELTKFDNISDFLEKEIQKGISWRKAKS